MPTALPRTPAFVRANGAAWDIVERETDVAIGSHPSLVAALDALLSLEYFAKAKKSPYLHDAGSKEPNGVWRWLDASAEEPAPAADGSQVTADGIRTMAARLCEGDPIMIDGGAPDSEAHESAYNTAALATGWAHVGADFVDAGGRVHLALYAELLPDVGAAFDSGRIAKGSVYFGHAADDPGDALLFSHALTNLPAVQGLTPSTAMKSHPRARELVFGMRTRRSQMPTPNDKNKAQRGQAQQKLEELRAMFGVPAEATESWQVTDYIYDVFRALANAAKLEKLFEGGTNGEPAPVAAQAGETREQHLDRIAAAVRDAVAAANAAPAPDATAAFASEVRTVLAAIFGAGDDAALLEKLKASQELIKGAVSGAPTTEPNPEATMADAAKESARELKLRTDLDTVTADAKAMREQLDALRAKERRRDIETKVDARIAAVKAKPTKETREKLVERAMRETDDAGVDDLLKMVLGPQQGMVMEATLDGARSATGLTSFRTYDDAIKHFEAVAAKADPKLEGNKRGLRDAAYKLLRAAEKKNPDAFRFETDGGDEE